MHLFIQVPEPVELFRHGTFGNVKREIEAARPGCRSLTSKERKIPTQLSTVQGLSPFHHRPTTFLIRNPMLGNVLTLLSALVPPGLSYQVLIPSQALPELLAYLTRQAGKPRGGSEQPL